MSLLAIMTASKRWGFQAQLERQLERQRVPYLYYYEPDFSWCGRVEWEFKVAEAHPDELLLFLDAWDVLMLGERSELTPLWLERGITISADRNCWPDPERAPACEARVEGSQSPWRYPCCGIVAGKGRTLAEALRWGLDRNPLAGIPADADYLLKHGDRSFGSLTGTDQRFWTSLYLDPVASERFQIRLDTECRFAVNLCGVFAHEIEIKRGRIVCKPMATRPVFAHSNGPSEMPADLIEVG